MSNRIDGNNGPQQPQVQGPQDADNVSPSDRARRHQNQDLTVDHRTSGPSLDGGLHDDFDVSASYGNLGKAIFDDYKNSEDILTLYSQVQAELHKVNKERQKSAHESVIKELGSYNDSVDHEVDDLGKQAKSDFATDLVGIGIKGVGSGLSAYMADPDNQARGMAYNSLSGSIGSIPDAFKAQSDMNHSATQKLDQKAATNAQTFLSEFQDTVRDGQSAMSKSVSDQAETQSNFNQSLMKAADMS